MLAAKNGSDNIIPVLLEAGSKAELVDAEGLSALDKALKTGNSANVKQIKKAMWFCISRFLSNTSKKLWLLWSFITCFIFILLQFSNVYNHYSKRNVSAALIYQETGRSFFNLQVLHIFAFTIYHNQTSGCRNSCQYI